MLSARGGSSAAQALSCPPGPAQPADGSPPPSVNRRLFESCRSCPPPPALLPARLAPPPVCSPPPPPHDRGGAQQPHASSAAVAASRGRRPGGPEEIEPATARHASAAVVGATGGSGPGDGARAGSDGHVSDGVLQKHLNTPSRPTRHPSSSTAPAQTISVDRLLLLPITSFSSFLPRSCLPSLASPGLIMCECRASYF